MSRELTVKPKSIVVGEFYKWRHETKPTAKAVKRASFTWFVNMDRPLSADGRESRITMRGGFIMQRQENGQLVDGSYYVRFPSQFNQNPRPGFSKWYDYVTDAEKDFGTGLGLIGKEIVEMYKADHAAGRVLESRNTAAASQIDLDNE